MAIPFEEAFAPYAKPFADLWGPLEGDALIQFIRRVTVLWTGKQEALRDRLSASDGSLIFVGSRFLDKRRMQLCAAQESLDMANRLGKPYHLLFSGGFQGEERTRGGEKPAGLLFTKLQAQCPYACSRFCTVDHWSMNTADQAYATAGMLLGPARSGKRLTLVVCLPIEHIARWVLIFCYAWAEISRGRQKQLTIFTMADGEWGQATRKPLTREAEAFGICTEANDALQWKYGLQYTNRLHDEVNCWVQKGFRCGANRPSWAMDAACPVKIF